MPSSQSRLRPNLPLRSRLKSGTRGILALSVHHCSKRKGVNPLPDVILAPAFELITCAKPEPHQQHASLKIEAGQTVAQAQNATQQAVGNLVGQKAERRAASVQKSILILSTYTSHLTFAFCIILH